jgi:hypothetical protein
MFAREGRGNVRSVLDIEKFVILQYTTRTAHTSDETKTKGNEKRKMPSIPRRAQVD